MNVFVTGASGFVGSALLPRILAEGCRVLALSRRPRTPSHGLDWAVGNLNDPGSFSQVLNRFEPAACVHLAWEGLPDYGPDTSRRNADLSVRLFDLVLGMGCGTLLATGTCWEYGPAAGPVGEGDPISTGSPFLEAKSRIRAAGEARATSHRARFVWARPFFVYGPGQRPSALVPSLIARLSSGRAPELRTPAAAHDFVYVDDVAAALVSLLRRPDASGVFNVGSGRATPVSDMARFVAMVIGGDTARLLPEGREVPEAGGSVFWADLARMSVVTGWRPVIGPEQGIRRTVEAARAQDQRDSA